MRKVVLVAAIALVSGAAFLFRKSILVTYLASRVCYEPGPARCHSTLRHLDDSTLDGRYVFSADAEVLLGIPVAWNVSIFWVGDDHLAPMGVHGFNPFGKTDSTQVHGLLRAEIVRRGSGYLIEANLDSLPRRIWLEMEKKP